MELTPSTSVGIEPPLAATYVRQSRGYCSRCLRDAGWLGYGVPRPDLPCPGCGDYTLTYEEFVAPCRHCGLGLEAHDDHTCPKFETHMEAGEKREPPRSQWERLLGDGDL